VNKYLWIDTETTGLSHKTHGIISLAGFYETHTGKISDGFNFHCQPHPKDKIDQRALDINGITMSEISEFPESSDVIAAVEKIFSSLVDKYDKKDKMILAGYNTKFDMRFLAEWFYKHDNNYFYSYFHKEPLDVLAMVRKYFKVQQTKPPNNKLTTVADFFGIEFDAHDALADIIATYKVYNKIAPFFGITPIGDI